MKIIRVFPQRTSYTPDDPMVFIGDPPLWRPAADEVHISVTFTWDIEEGKRLAEAWGNHYPVVHLGGPALNSPANEFISGMYIKHGVTFTSRGCDNHCPWCLVPQREGKLIELSDFAPGHIIQDNNLLQASRTHLRQVFAMLKTQRKAATFAGGLDARLVNDWIVEQLRGLRISQIFLAADTEAALVPLETALQKLSFLPRRKKRVYVMIGYRGDETINDAIHRLEETWQLGGLPFAQLYQPPDAFFQYPYVWRAIARTWSRPAAMFDLHQVEADSCSGQISISGLLCAASYADNVLTG